MLTYPLSKESGRSLYEQLYEGIRRDILSGTLPAHQRLPSKRALAQHLEVSIITVQNAYEQLAAEGYIYSQEKRGYYVSPVERPLQAAARQPAPLPPEPEQKTYFLDLVTNSIDRAYFPFTVWARLMRETLLERDKALLQAAPYNGAEELRRAISDYLRQFRGMNVDSGQIIVGAGTEFLYSLLIQLLGREKCYAVEDPGYSKIAEIYRSHQVNLRQVGLDEKGLSTRLLRRQEADIVPPTTIPRASSCPSDGGRSCCAGRRSRRDAGYWRMTTTASSASWAAPSPRCSPSTRPSGSST